MVWKSRWVVLLFFVVHTNAVLAQQRNRYVVFFTDKNDSPYSIADPSPFLSQKAIGRRLQQNIPVNESDIPVSPAYIQGVREAGAEVFFRSRWFNAVLVQCEPALVESLAQLSYVKSVEYVAPGARLVHGGRKKTNEKAKATKNLGATKNQLQMLGIDEMHEAGYRGDDITIAVFDSGFPGVNSTQAFKHLFDEARITFTVDLVYNSDNVYQYDAHGTEVFSVIAGYQPGAYTGGAYKADFQLYVTEETPSEFRVEEYNWLFAAEKADSAGVDIIHSSLGYYDFDDPAMNYPKSAMNGATAVITRAAQLAFEKGMLVVTSAGNEGNFSWRIITAPADAADILAVANVTLTGQRVSSSSVGPTADGRIKPDVAALGSGTSVIRASGAIGTASGTSLSAPLITSLAAGAWQRYPTLTNRELLDVIRQAGSQSSAPDNFLGYGIPHFREIVSRIEHRSQENPFEIYPNPAYSDSIIIRPYSVDDVPSCRIELISSTGRTVLDTEASFSWLKRTFEAPVSHLPSGHYFIRIYWSGNTSTYKLMRMR